MKHGSYSIKCLRFALIFLLAFGWIFSGWPQIGNFPPKVQHAYAAVTYVGGQVGSSAGLAGNTTVTFALTGGSNTTPQAGDLVVIAFSNADTADKTLTIKNPSAVSYTIAGGTDLYQNGSSYDSNFIVGYEFMPATPEASATLAGGDASGGRAWSVHVFRGVDPNTPLDVAAVTIGGTGTHLADPGAITPSTSGAIIYVAGAGAIAAGTNYTAAYLTDLRTAAGADSQDADIGTGYVTWTSGAYDPAAFTGGGTVNSANSWNAVTLALRPTSVPTVTTQDATAIGQTSATFNGTITATGGAGPTMRGFAWGTSNNMTGDTATTTDTVGAPFGTGAFTDSAQTLTCNTTYYYRPYAVNSVGTSTAPISNSFTTTACVPTVTTQDATAIGQTSATFNGTITATGGAGPTMRGFAWGTSNNMTGDTATTTDTVGAPFGTGAFTDSAQTLTCNTTYYYRPYAVNSAGTSTAPISNSFATSACSAVYSVSITPAGNIEYGFVSINTASTTLGTSYTKTATNDGTATEKLNVKSSDATGGTGWTLASTIGVNQYKHEFSTTTGSRWDVMPDSATYVTADPSVAVSGTVNFDFRLTAPSSSDYQQKSITITVQAVAPG